MMPTLTGHKHSFSVPSTPASAIHFATSPSVTRSAKIERPHPPPATPKRTSRAYGNHFSSPIATVGFSTPYTPLTFRSSASSNGSVLNTPASALSMKKLTFAATPEIVTNSRDRSLADIADNWRARANQHGIKVSSIPDDPHYADDEASELAFSEANSSEFITVEEALLQPPFMSTQRRARAQSQVLPPRIPLSPQVQYTPARRPLGILNTPPPAKSSAQRFGSKGCFTDPPQPRRRPSFGQTKADPFDFDDSLYETYPQAFCSPTRPVGLPISFNDPFYTYSLPTIAESEPQQFPRFDILSQTQLHQHSTLQEVIASEAKTPKIDTSICSVCNRSSGALAILEPCGHPLCSACLTSALNIVGEKDMECAVCKVGVANFHLKGPTDVPYSLLASTDSVGNSDTARKSFLEALVSPTASPVRKQSSRDGSMGLLPSAFEIRGSALNENGDFFASARGVSTPIPGRNESRNAKDCAVLRIDNVPWDITPPAVISWLKQPVVRVHVLLDPKGKTLSHAFVEVADEDVAKAILRGAQNSVLGKGKRARGVTVTMSGQEELMRALFPSWKGKFDGSRPSLAELENQQVISTLEAGLLSKSDLTSLLLLIRSPDSHFLKVPSLPFYALISILFKFPTDVDSRVFWSGTLRDLLYDVTFSAVEILVTRINSNNKPEDIELLSQLVISGMHCQAFTSQQMSKLSTLLDSASLPTSTIPTALAVTGLDASLSNGENQDSFARAPESERENDAAMANPKGQPEQDSFGELAKEFGVEAQLVQALAQRLSAMH